MAHHSSDGPIDPKAVEAFRKMVTEPALEEKIKELMGPTGRQPEPQLGPNDEGELQYRVGVMKDDAGNPKIVIDFGSPVHSIGFNKAQACELGRLLINRAGFKCTVHID